MGHNFGFVHDTDQSVLPCPCHDPTGDCIMHPTDRSVCPCSKITWKNAVDEDLRILNMYGNVKMANWKDNKLKDAEW